MFPERVFPVNPQHCRSGGRRGGEHSAIVSWGSTDEAAIDSEEDEVRRRGAWELEAAAVESTAARRGYTTGAAWDEGAMIPGDG